jgi:hypothetical protein
MGPFCQSCGMPLSQDPGKGGTELDGSNSQDYCSYCYQNGAFLQPDMTATGMQAFCMAKLQEKGTLKPLAWLFTRGIPKLKRWAQ